jgi:hypothetical protein
MVAARKSSVATAPSIFVNFWIRLMLVDIPLENVESRCWMYSINNVDFGAQRPIFMIRIKLVPMVWR